jgi:uncharacterized protein (DUF302 family)
MTSERRVHQISGSDTRGFNAYSVRRKFLGKLAAIAGSVTVALIQKSNPVRAESGANDMSGNGLITVPSAHDVQDTINRVETIVKAKGLTVFARVDHAAGAKEVGLTLAPTLLLIFGNAKGGTPLMQANQQVGIDLPLKVLAWQDSAGKTWLTYNDPQWIAQRHGLSQEVEPTVKALSGVLAAISKEATA